MGTKREVTVTEFKARCLRLMAEVQRTGRPITVTKRGKPLVEITAAKAKRGILGCMEGTLGLLDYTIRPTMSQEEMTRWREKNIGLAKGDPRYTRVAVGGRRATKGRKSRAKGDRRGRGSRTASRGR